MVGIELFGVMKALPNYSKLQVKIDPMLKEREIVASLSWNLSSSCQD